MELRSSVHAAATRRNKLPEFLSVALIMLRKGLVSKRKFITHACLVVSKKGKPMSRNLRNLVLHRSSRSTAADPFGLQEYEFSCSNSPTNSCVSYSYSSSCGRSWSGHGFFSCMSSRAVEVLEGANAGAFQHPAPVEYSPAAQCAHSPAAGEQCRQLRASLTLPDAISTYCESDDEREVDVRAEEFIRKFYEQLRAQNNHAYLQ